MVDHNNPLSVALPLGCIEPCGECHLAIVFRFSAPDECSKCHLTAKCDIYRAPKDSPATGSTRRGLRQVSDLRALLCHIPKAG